MSVVLTPKCLVPQPVAFPIPGTVLRELREDICFCLPYSHKWLLIRAGYRSDGASIPRILWTPVGNPYEPDYEASAWAHDALYEAELLDKHGCDKELFHLMRHNSAEGHCKSREFFIAVDECGDSVWSEHTPESIASARIYCAISDTRPEGFGDVPVITCENEPIWDD